MSISCLRVPAMSVNAMQGVLRKNGVPPSPMEKFALTSFAATRDPSMKAQAREEFSKLDLETQAKLKALSKDLVVRATRSAFDPEDMAGVSAPLGFWDPAGFAKDEESVAQYRRAEIKHDRVCMSSSLGMLVADKFHPIFDNWNEGPFVSSMASHFSETATKNFWPAFWIMTAGHELATTFADYEGKEEFDYGFDPLNLRPEDPEKQKEYKTMELNHAVGQCSVLLELSHRSWLRARALSRASAAFFKVLLEDVLLLHCGSSTWVLIFNQEYL